MTALLATILTLLLSVLVLVAGADGRRGRRLADIPPVARVADFGVVNGRGIDLDIVYKDKLYFTMTDDEHGRELWVYDEVQGARLFADIFEGPGESSSPRYFIIFDGLLFFACQGWNFADRGLWVTDGTQEGTKLVHRAEIPSTDDAFPLMLFDNNLYFFSETEIFRVQPSTFAVDTGFNHVVARVADFGVVNGRGIDLDIVYKDKLYFTMTDDEHGRELWVYDEVQGARLFADIFEGPGESSSPRYFIIFDGLLFFACQGWNFADRGLWVTDGTQEGTKLVHRAEIPSTDDAFPLMLFDNNLYFFSETEIFRVQPSTFAVDTGFNHVVARVADFGVVNGRGIGLDIVYKDKLYFTMTDDEHGRELWVYDEVQGARLFADIFEGPDESSSPRYFIIFDGLLFFACQASNFADRGLWVTDGTQEGTKLVHRAEIPSTDDAFPLILFDNNLYFFSETEIFRVEDQAMEGSEVPTPAPTTVEFTEPPTAAPSANTDGTVIFLEDPKCPADWRSDFRAWKRNRKSVWKFPKCYTFTFERSCFCRPDWFGPFNIKVRKRRIVFVERKQEDGTVVGVDDFAKLRLLNMDQLLNSVFKTCYKRCAADATDGYDVCRANYNPEVGYLESFSYNKSPFIADAGYLWKVSNFKECEA